MEMPSPIFDGNTILWKRKKGNRVFLLEGSGRRRGRRKDKKKTEKRKMCVGRQQEGKSGQQRAEVKATLLLGDWPPSS